MSEIRKTDDGFRDYKKDYQGIPIAGGSAIVGIINTVIFPIIWTPIVMPSDKACKQLVITERDKEVWRLSVESDGSAFLTVTGPLTMEIAASEEQILFYAQTITASGGDTSTLEILLVD